MSSKNLTQALTTARATAVDDRPAIDAVVDGMVMRSREVRRRRSLKWLAMAAVPVGGLALAGAAVTVDRSLHPDVIIPVHYVTDTGVVHDCTIYIEGGSMLNPGTTIIGDELKKRDWQGVGQRMYSRALELSEALAASSTMPAADRDAWAWSAAESQLTVLDLPGIELPEGENAVSVSDCDGLLH